MTVRSVRQPIRFECSICVKPKIKTKAEKIETQSTYTRDSSSVGESGDDVRVGANLHSDLLGDERHDGSDQMDVLWKDHCRLGSHETCATEGLRVIGIDFDVEMQLTKTLCLISALMIRESRSLIRVWDGQNGTLRERMLLETFDHIVQLLLHSASVVALACTTAWMVELVFQRLILCITLIEQAQVETSVEVERSFIVCKLFKFELQYHRPGWKEISFDQDRFLVHAVDDTDKVPDHGVF